MKEQMREQIKLEVVVRMEKDLNERCPCHDCIVSMCCRIPRGFVSYRECDKYRKWYYKYMLPYLCTKQKIQRGVLEVTL